MFTKFNQLRLRRGKWLALPCLAKGWNRKINSARPQITYRYKRKASKLMEETLKSVKELRY